MDQCATRRTQQHAEDPTPASTTHHQQLGARGWSSRWCTGRSHRTRGSPPPPDGQSETGRSTLHGIRALQIDVHVHLQGGLHAPWPWPRSDTDDPRIQGFEESGGCAEPADVGECGWTPWEAQGQAASQPRSRPSWRPAAPKPTRPPPPRCRDPLHTPIIECVPTPPA